MTPTARTCHGRCSGGRRSSSVTGWGYRDIDVDIIDIDVDTLKVGYSWIDHLKLEADKLVTDLQMKFAESR